MASILISDDSEPESDSDNLPPFPHNSKSLMAVRTNVPSMRSEESPTKRGRKRKATENEEIMKAVAASEKIRLKEEKKRQREIDKATKKAAKETRKESQSSADRLQQMVLMLHSTLAENTNFMEALVEELEEAGVEYQVAERGPAGSVRWKRKHCERTVTADAQINETTSEVDEMEMLLTLEAQGFSGLVHNTKMEQQGVHVHVPQLAQTLNGYIEDVKREQSGVRVSLAVEGMDAFFRGNKTKNNRKFRKHVLGYATTDSSTVPSEVTWLDCQEAITSLQLQAGCTVRLCKGPEELAQYVFSLTKALSEKPFRKDSPFSFHPDAVSGNKKRVDSGDQLATTWKNQLMQFNNLSNPMASAVVAKYPTPSHLLTAYSTCDEQSAALLLQDITVRRGVGSVASTRRLGPVQSRRVHCLLTTTDPYVTIT